MSQSEADAAYEAVRNEAREDASPSLTRSKAKVKSNKSSAAILSLLAENRT